MAAMHVEQNEPQAPLHIKAVVDDKGKCDVTLLEKVLSRAWEREVHVKCAQAEPASTKGTYFTSDVWRVHFTYQTDDVQGLQMDSVVVKTCPACEETSKLMNTKTAFTNEIYSYEQVIPILNNHIGIPIRTPKFYHGNEHSIVLEDMRKRSFEAINKKLAVEWKQIWSPIEEMAKLHAASIVMKRTSPEKFETVVNSIIKVPIEETAMLGERQNNSLDTILKVLEESNNPEASKHIAMLQDMRSESWARQKAIIEEDVPVRVINHGSIWINNLLYREDMCSILDWQHIVYSSPAQDLSFFLYVNLDIDFLANKKQQIIEFYLVNLHQFVFDGCVSRITADELNELLSQLSIEWINKEMKRFSMYGYMMAQWITPVFYWSEAVFQTFKDKGGLEYMSVEERMKHLTSDQKDRMVKLTKLYAEESK